MQRKICLLLISLCLVSCAPKVKLLASGDAWDVPVTSAKVENGGAEKVDVVITVPPAQKTTKIQIRRKTRTVKQLLKETMTNTPKYEVLADNPGAQANQPKKSVWWRWLLAIIPVAAGAAAFVWRVTSVKRWIIGLLKRSFRRG